jgi:hypothetical protein
LIVQADPNNHTNILYYVELITESGNIIGDETGFIVSIKQAQPASTAEIDKILSETPTYQSGE